MADFFGWLIGALFDLMISCLPRKAWIAFWMAWIAFVVFLIPLTLVFAGDFSWRLAAAVVGVAAILALVLYGGGYLPVKTAGSNEDR
jgi:riboflavin transporter FmnP